MTTTVLSNTRRAKVAHWFVADRPASTADAWPAIYVTIGGGLTSIVFFFTGIIMIFLRIGPDTGDEQSTAMILTMFVVALFSPLLLLFLYVQEHRYVVGNRDTTGELSPEYVMNAGRSYRSIMVTGDRDAKRVANSLITEINLLRPDRSDGTVECALQERCTVMDRLAVQTVQRARREKLISDTGVTSARDLIDKYRLENEARKELA